MIGDELHPRPTTKDPAPKSLVDIPQCGCSKSKCSNNQCKCRSKNEYCSDVCTCVGCENRPQLDDNACDLNDSLLDDATEDEGEDESDDEEDYDDENDDSD